MIDQSAIQVRTLRDNKEAWDRAYENNLPTIDLVIQNLQQVPPNILNPSKDGLLGAFSEVLLAVNDLTTAMNTY